MHGVSGTVSVYNPSVGKDQKSSAVIWVRSGPPDNSNIITIGWHVSINLCNYIIFFRKFYVNSFLIW